MEDVEVLIEISDDAKKLKEYLDEWGIKYSWVCAKLEHKNSWLTRVFSGIIPLTPEKKAKIENIMPHFKF